MPLPTLEYSNWRFNVNQTFTTVNKAVDNPRYLLAIKNTLISSTGWTDSDGYVATLSSPWVVVASSNSTTADTSDNWNSDNDLVYSTGAHSWIVLRQTGISGQNSEVCFDLTPGGSSFQIAVKWSHNGFDLTNLNTSTSPVSTDQFIFTKGNSLVGSSSLHVSITDGGECTRIMGYIGGITRILWTFDKPKYVIPGWDNPSFHIHVFFEVPNYTALNVNNNRMITNLGGLLTPAHLTAMGYFTNYIGNISIPNGITGEWPIIPARIYSVNNGYSGIVGEVADMWWGSVGVTTGDTYPDTGVLKQFVTFGNLIFPWNKTLPILTA